MEVFASAQLRKIGHAKLAVRMSVIVTFFHFQQIHFPVVGPAEILNYIKNQFQWGVPIEFDNYSKYQKFQIQLRGKARNNFISGKFPMIAWPLDIKDQ